MPNCDGPYDNHVLIGKAIKNIPRDQVVIASKWGVMKDEQGNYTQDNTAAFARKSLEEHVALTQKEG
ncbi:hypothetical protein WJX77_012292 [Trebouxia sp. C0004]